MKMFNNIFFQSVCLPISCVIPAEYDAASAQCRPTFSRINQVKYNMYIEYFVSVDSLAGTCNGCFDTFGEAFWNSMNNFTSNFGLKHTVCSLRLLNGAEPQNSSMYFLSEISLYIGVFHKYTEMLNTFLKFSSMSIYVNTTVAYEVKSNIVGSQTYPELEKHISQRSLNTYNTTRPPRRVPEGCDGFVILNVDVSHAIICPLVRLSDSLSVINNDNYSISIHGTDITFASGRIDVINNSYYVCIDEYINAVKGMKLDGYITPITGTDRVEGIVTLIGLCTTAVCLLITIVTYSIFKSLRTAPGLNNLSLAVVLLIANVLFSFSFRFASYPTACSTLGVLTHFFWLSAIVWMNVCCIHMFKVFSSMKMISTNSTYMKSYLFYAGYSTILPSIFISANVAYSDVIEHDIGYGGKTCFIVRPHMVLFTFALPIGLLIVVNILLFSIVLFKLRKMKDMPNSTAQRNVFVIYAKLSTLTGCSWIFGFLYQFTNIKALSFIFIVLTTFQGLFLMLAFICNKRVANLYLSKFSGTLVGKSSMSLTKLSPTVRRRSNYKTKKGVPDEAT